MEKAAAVGINRHVFKLNKQVLEIQGLVKLFFKKIRK